MNELRKNAEVDNLELFYDLIFAYAISRITTVLHLVHHETISGLYLLEFFVMFFMFWTIWTYQTVLVNRFFRNTLQHRLFMVFDMFVVIILSQSLNANFAATHLTFAGSTSVLLLSIAGQYWLRSRSLTDPKQLAVSRGLGLILLVSGVVGALTIIPVGPYIVRASIYVLTMVFANIAPMFMYRQLTIFPAMFEHLTERYSLFTLLLFGEAIIAVASVIDVHHFNWLAIPFFIIIVALFTIYFTTYQHGIDRHRKTAGILLINIHYFIFVGLDLVTAVTELYLQRELHGPLFAGLVTLGLMCFLTGTMAMAAGYSKDTSSRISWSNVGLATVAALINGGVLWLFSEHVAVTLLILMLELLAVAGWWFIRLNGQKSENVIH
ncbi:low temperature requirement protein A [Furfurilactobacillus siliginis]|uniref:Bacitracin ABC transporter permease n=1 Tax=Furfurilactobacillus siliginis TaxID=348151 RepID=A0A0R2LCX8_9LACO|nr:low temperature requirement protein A [Furfurilactobacillus siliginis]KRN96493.1 Low temperature requirement protein LtrA [Furfurilactobacillus siliginis]GEK29634.1 bacitracin ABC transporter permease [Furfurilactobacillus siliginis]